MNKGLIAFTLAAIALVVFLVVTYAGKVSMLYLKTDEVLDRLQKSAATQHQGPDSLVGKYFRIHGHLKAKSTKRMRGRLDYQFQIKGKSGRTLLVRYKGILPDTFRDGAELVIEGKLESPTMFTAYNVFAKCPSRYNEKAKGGKQKAKATNS